MNENRIIANNGSSIVLYTTDDGNTQLEVKLEKDTLWLTQSQMAELFGIDRTTILSSSASAMHRSSIHPRKNVCLIAATTMRMPLCSELVEPPLGEHVSCLEYEDERSRSMSDDQVMLYLFEEFKE